MSAYEKLHSHFGRLARVNEAGSMLHWDASTMMPNGAAEGRSEQLATLKVIAHELLTDVRLGAWLEEAGADTSLDDWQLANVREMRREYIHATAVPARLVEELSKKGSACEMVWRKARKDNDFATLRPYLTEVLALTRETAQVKGEALGLKPYDALLDQYEPGGFSARIDAIFDDLASFLPGFLERVLEKQARGPAILPLEGPFAENLQRQIGLELTQALGFEFERGRLDTSLHPFCGGVPDDVRMTTCYTTQNFTKSLMGVLHETGHALYEQGLPKGWRYQPVGHARGMSIHESQSLLVEMQVCRSQEFVHFVAPRLGDVFGGSGPAWQEENLYRLYTRVERGLIRVDADEVTYPAHVILRYRLEKAMIAGELDIAELPGAWKAGMKELVGIAPSDDRDGCMQDIHWMDGAFGYFPTYTLGAMSAAQLFHSARQADPSILPAIAQGNFGPILSWLRENIHAKASLLSTDELMVAATGQTLDASFFKAHLMRRYLEG